jgi:hypothetical protein
MIQKACATAAALVALAVPGLARADAKPSWCDGGSGPICNAADHALSGRLGEGGRPYENAWRSESHSTVGINRHQDPDCYAYEAAGSVQCFAFYSYRGRFFFIDASVGAAEATRGTAHIYSVKSYRRRWVRCPLGKDAIGASVPGHLTSNNACGDGQGEDEPYFVSVEMGGYEGTVRFTREVGWQFTDSGYISSSFFNAVGLYRCTNGSVITCRDGAGDEFKYTR